MNFLVFLFGLISKKAHAETFYELYGQDLLPGFSGSGGAAEFAMRVIAIISEVIGAAAVIMIIYGGLKIAMSRGNDEGRTQGKNIIIAALVGVVLAMLGYTAVLWVQTFVSSVPGTA